MASIPFTLAALATSAVPDLVVLGVSLDEQGEAFRSAVITNGIDEFLVRVPRTELAEVRQSAELLGLASLNEGSRAVLPFEVPETLGMTRAGDTRAVVTTFIGGDQFEVDHLKEDSLLLQPIAEMLAAIHGLPLNVAQQGGLPVRSAQDLRLQATRVIDRAEATRLLPQTVLDRWKHVVETSELWDFAPTMVHGSLDADHLRISSDQITGVVGWSELSVGDPASDMAWLLNAGSEVLDGVLARYAKLHTSSSIPIFAFGRPCMPNWKSRAGCSTASTPTTTRS
ncbi:phosphotransferase [Leucobacter coleopterorum]|uniref:phosphotransferase n=1 Tax=Leucobacter coleopterorum TaxID=2714933 RepID=UPI001FCC3AD9|nr:phosphotransferase [Leucobacter coleopterorum]